MTARHHDAATTRETFVARFPRAFFPKGNPKRPLKVGIDLDIVRRAPDLTPESIRRALHDYTSGPTYLRHMTAGTTRVDLDGEDAGVIGEPTARWALNRLHNMFAPVKLAKLRAAVHNLYYAANWYPDRECNASELWEELRDAAGLPKGGTATHMGARNATFQRNDS